MSKSKTEEVYESQDGGNPFGKVSAAHMETYDGEGIIIFEKDSDEEWVQAAKTAAVLRSEWL